MGRTILLSITAILWMLSAWVAALFLSLHMDKLEDRLDKARQEANATRRALSFCEAERPPYNGPRTPRK